MGNVHMPVMKWSKIRIDADKDMKGKSLTNVNQLIANNLVGALDANGGDVVNVGKLECNEIGSFEKRVGDVYFGGDIYLPVVIEPGESLIVDVIHEGDYQLVAEYSDEQHFSSNDWVDDWDIGELNTFTGNGVITGIKLVVDLWGQGTSYPIYYRLLEDDVEVMSLAGTGYYRYYTFEGEIYTLKYSAHYKTQAKITLDEGRVKNRYLYFKKCYLGLKRG